MKKILTINLLLASLCSGLAPCSQAAPADNDRYQLEKVVMLIRHGVRPQTNTASLDKATGLLWPEWNVPDGFLTGHGYAGMLAQGAWLLKTWRAAGLPLNETAGCPAAGNVWVWTAPSQRTKATGTALLDGMFPGCGIPIHFTAHKADPLFDTVAMGIATPDKDKVYQQIEERLGSAARAEKTYRKAVADLRQAVCAETTNSCRFLDNPWKINISEHGKVKSGGPLSEGANIGETIRLQYSENLPLSEVAFGHARNARQVSDLMALHAAKYDLISDTLENASHGGSLLMRQIIRAFTPRQGSNTSLRSDNDPLQSPLVIFAAHDTNIAQIQTMLGFNWQLPLYPRNDIPPGGALIIGRYLDTQTGQRFIRLTFTARTLDQWRQLSPLNAQDPLPVAEFRHSGCRETAVGELCPLNVFTQLAKAHLVNDGKDLPVFQ
ncbi:histidine-type phosphatase [Tatumella ptyseos]|uniref:histidine-type phosphatase n=1 Tax=Tatumella ptyseos TaxID=82987 RepID=UPI0023EF6816|nr:histidine-type phosphatase [Tatumella ptyseos]